MTTVTEPLGRPCMLEIVIAVADIARGDGVVYTRDALRQMGDGVRLFWDEASGSMIWRGPAEEVACWGLE
jgi:hypothetical protein